MPLPEADILLTVGKRPLEVDRHPEGDQPELEPHSRFPNRRTRIHSHRPEPVSIRNHSRSTEAPLPRQVRIRHIHTRHIRIRHILSPRRPDNPNLHCCVRRPKSVRPTNVHRPLAVPWRWRPPAKLQKLSRETS